MIRKAFSIYGKLFGSSHARPDLSRETAWLDGVRGVAAFLVMISHYSMDWLSPFSDAPFGAVVLNDTNPDGVWWYRKGERLWEPWRLPILRVLMCSGDAQVAVFFVLSGFVLSWGPLKLVRANNHDKLAQSLGSSVVRRWFRLYLPCFIVSTVFLLEKLFGGYHGLGPLFEETWKFITGTENWARPFDTNRVVTMAAAHPYNFVMWTIPFEFSGSIFVYVTLLSFGRVRNYHRRMLVSIVVSLYAVISLYWCYWLFGSGLILADYVQQAGGFKALSQQTSRRSSYFWFSILIAGLLLMGYAPSHAWYTSPTYEWMSRLPIPSSYRDLVGEGRLWWGWGGIFVVASSCHLSFVRKFFEISFVQYLGRISFMLYLIHIVVDTVIGQALRRHLYQSFSTREFSETFHGDIYLTTPSTNILVLCILWSVCIPISMSAAHFLEIYVDRPSTNLGKVIDDKLLNGFGRSKMPLREEEQLLQSARSAELELGEVTQR